MFAPTSPLRFPPKDPEACPGSQASFKVGFRGNIGIMEKKMETTIVCGGYMGLMVKGSRFRLLDSFGLRV